MADHGRVQHSGSRPSSAEQKDHRHIHSSHGVHPGHATAGQGSVQSSNISVLSPAEPVQGSTHPPRQPHPPPPGNIHSHPGAGQPILTIGSGQSQPYNSVDIVDINNSSNANGLHQGHPRSHMQSRPHRPPNNPRFPIPTTNSKFDHNAPPGVEDGPPLQGRGAGQAPEGIQKQPPGILSQ